MQAKSGQPPRKKPGRASLPPLVAPPKGSPFAGISGTHAPARNTSIPNLTEHVAVAKARVAALQDAGLVPEAKRVAAEEAQRIIAAAPKTSTAAPKSGDAPPSKPEGRTVSKRAGSRAQATSPTLPAWLTKPAVSLDGPTRTPAASPTALPPPGRRGAPNPRAGMAAAAANRPHSNLLGSLRDAASIGLGTALEGAASIPGTLFTPIHPGATHTTAEDVKPTHTSPALADISRRSQAIAATASRLGSAGGIPHGFSLPGIELVAPAGAATVKGAITPDELKRLEEQGYDLKPRLKTRFTKQALENGWNPAEIDGISGSALIDKAFTKPAAMPLRLLGNFAGGVAKLGTLPAGVEGAARETAAGHGLDVAKALGEGLYSELPIVGKHRTTDTAIADPFGFISQFAGAGKTVGTLSRLGKAGTTVERSVRTSSGLVVDRGLRDKNAYTALGQAASDKAAASIPRIGEKLEAEVIDKSVRRLTNKHAPAYVAVQRPYKKALDAVGRKRAAELSGFQMAGWKPEQLAAFYRSQGNADNAKFFDGVAASTRILSPEDRAFLQAHAALAEHTSQSHVDVGKFGPTAVAFRRYSPLIRSAAHLGDPDAQRTLALRDEYLKGFKTMPEEDLAALRGAIDQSVEDFANQHLRSGGSDPVYVEYSQPKPLIAPPYKPGPGGATGFKKPRGRQKVETGATFESGKYLIDPSAPLTESVRAQRAHLADVLHEDVTQAVGRRVTAGDEIPHGNVFVSETNLRGLRRTVNDLEDNPVSQQAYDEYAAQKQGIFDRLTGAAVPSTERVPRGEKGYVIPIGSWKRILDHTRPPSRSAWDKTMSQYQRLLVSYRPSTIVNNTVGSIPLAMTGGAVTPRPWLQAIQAMRDPELAPAILRGHGVAGSMAPSARSKIGAGMDFMRAQSARGEDFSRLATYFAKAGPTFKKRAAELEMSADAYQRALSRGDVDPQQLDSFLDHAEKFVGDVAKPDGKLGRAAGRGILFHRWIGHMAKLMLYTLPVEHPRRLSILLTLSNYGDQYRQEHGVWPDWYREYLPLFQHVERIGKAGKAQTFTKTFSTQGVNPFSTLNNFANPVNLNDVSGESATEAIKDLLLGVSAPPIQVIGKTLVDRPSDSHDAGRFLVGQTIRQIPGITVAKPQGGMAPDSIPFISEQRKKYTGTRPGSTLPFEFRPTARAEGGILGGLLRYGLGGVYDVPAQGPIHNIDQRKHIGAKAKAARKAR